MEVVVDASVLIAVITNEEEKEKLVALTDEAELIAPSTSIGRAERTPLAVKGIRLNLSRGEILQNIEEGRRVP
jgi:uncharacterized protein with PIN domain